MSIQNSVLVARVRAALADEADVRQVPMFGGLSFMLHERLLVSAGADAAALGDDDDVTFWVAEARLFNEQG